MYDDICGIHEIGVDIVQNQRERAFQQDWGNLIDDIKASFQHR